MHKGLNFKTVNNYEAWKTTQAYKHQDWSLGPR
jgi:hypothetical protein